MKMLRKNRKKLGNKGFSLVELIIVIAIMAVLVAILAPQYLKYVEKSRVSADEANADNFLNAAQVMTVDPDLNFADGTGTITWTGSTVTVAGDNAATITAQLTSILGADYATAEVQSNEYTADDNDTYVVTIAIADGIPTVSGSWGAGS